MNKKLLASIITLPLLVTCGDESGPGPDIHDTKYAYLDNEGQVLNERPDIWACVLDQFTGLIWEVKSETEGLHYFGNTYSWYSPDESNDGELDYRGTADGGDCSGSACDTHAWVEAVNAEGLCGYHDWRLASKDELASINDARKVNSPPTINTDYFPNTQPAEYWTGFDYSFQWDAAWRWNFKLGHDRVEWKATPGYTRLVRGEAGMLERVKD
jgi:hypothetical protein